jgi:homogentisate 1,2-dioxygenase
MMMARDPVNRRQWLNESEAGRRQMLKEYREELQTSTIDETISIKPIDFVIEQTTYNQTNGVVVVMQKFRGGENFIEVKQYTYDLVKKDGIWTVVNYTVRNIGTE